ncbi:MAG: leucine-rich repeat protein [Oscillospiraceae bacterium]|nr:leucine-rich repeat protein [Oscillospiraceae bacterium]
MKIKKIMSGILASVIFMGGIPYYSGIINNTVLIAEAVETGTYESLKYNKYDDHIEIIGCATSDTVVIIPSKIEGLPVTHIGNNAFERIKSEYVVIPYGVTSIGDFAFSYCENLKEIKIPDSVTSIGNVAFGSCYSITEITIPDSVKSVGHNAFAVCLNLRKVTIPNSITSMERQMFSDCRNLEKVIIQDGAILIGDYMFAGCIGLEEIKIPESVKSIGSHAFMNCTSLKEIDIRNPECEMSDAKIPEGTTIYGWGDSTALDYANQNGNPYYNMGTYYSLTTTTITTTMPTTTTTTTLWITTMAPPLTSTIITNNTTTTLWMTTMAPPLTSTTITTNTTVKKIPTVIPKEISIRANDSRELIVLNCDNPENIIWVSSDEEVAVVENGYVKGLSEGQATIYAVINDVYCECKVTVKPPVADTGSTKKGDANGDGLLDVADVVAVASYVGNPNANKLDAQCIKNADVHNTGDGLTANDALMIQQYLAKIIEQL